MAAAAGKPVLYSYWRSSCSWRVRIALIHKGIEYDYVPVNLLEGKQLEPEYADTHKTKLLPTLNIDGFDLSESVAILEYLEEARDGPKLLPAAPLDRAQVRKLVNIIACDTQPIQNLRVLKYVGADKKLEWGKHWIGIGLSAYETAIQDCAGKYSFGDEVSLADVVLIPQLYNARRFGVDLDEFPRIQTIEAALLELDAFKESHPDKCPDAVPQ